MKRNACKPASATANCMGGAVLGFLRTKISITNSVLQENNATVGGGIAQGTEGGSHSDARLTLENCKVEQNSASRYGGGIAVLSSVQRMVDFPSISECTIRHNSAVSRGGGMHFSLLQWPLVGNTVVPGSVPDFLSFICPDCDIESNRAPLQPDVALQSSHLSIHPVDDVPTIATLLEVMDGTMEPGSSKSFAVAIRDSLGQLTANQMISAVSTTASQETNGTILSISQPAALVDGRGEITLSTVGEIGSSVLVKVNVVSVKSAEILVKLSSCSSNNVDFPIAIDDYSNNKILAACSVSPDIKIEHVR